MAIEIDETVLVTGANGFLGAHVVYQLLERGARVNGTVRSEKSASILRKRFSKEAKEGRLRIFLVPDISAQGAFDLAAQGVDHIAHIAAPIPTRATEDLERSILKPSIQSTESILTTAQKLGVKSVVLTSSMAAVFRPDSDPNSTLTERDWNPSTYDSILSLIKEASCNLDGSSGRPLSKGGNIKLAFQVYMGAKAVSERRAWELSRSQDSRFSLTCINPVYFAGPTILGAPLESSSNSELWSTLTVEGKGYGIPGWVDVRDVARSHVLSVLDGKGKGGRYLAVSDQSTPRQLRELASRAFPERFTNLASQRKEDEEEESTRSKGKEQGKPSRSKSRVRTAKQRIDGTLLEKAFDFNYTPIDKTIRDLVDQVVKYGP
ncbi:NAD(P)-binding protein [Violaceomyces palustris]|uniref:NAD(P)-binding protein n=1 Tax=Violaceomyces palustris TaxID=1673888 RepID=A0ACD0NLE5_9BASI|nr:NAD(P)-binding protein [Violaceomyces palustris]